MHVGTISFCDRVVYNIKSSDTKDAILADLEGRYRVKILSRHWTPLDAAGVSHMQRVPHLACLRSNGNPYYLYFTMQGDTQIAYYVDKKVQPGYEKPRILLAKGRFDPCLFENGGTLLEGEMLRDKSAAWVFLINDVIAWRGRYLEREPLPDRLARAYRLLSEHYTPDAVIDACTFQVKRFAPATREAVSALVELADSLPYSNRGVYFWPYFLSFKPKLVNFDDTLIKEVHRDAKDSPEFRMLPEPAAAASADAGCEAEVAEPEPAPAPVGTASAAAAELTATRRAMGIAVKRAVLSEGEKIFYLKKTENPDIYELYPSDHAVTAQKVGVAHVSSMATSKMLRGVFRDLSVAFLVPFKCVMNERFSKWTPIAQVGGAAEP